MKIKQIINSIKERKLYFIMAIVIFIVDFVSKELIDIYMLDAGVHTIPVLGSILRFEFVKNPGIAFGMLNNLPALVTSIVEVMIPIIVCVAMVLISTLMCSFDMKKNRISLICFSFILGGAIGNFVDRLMRGYVTDFISMGFTENIRFNYIYNVADAFITIGVFIMIIAIVFLKEDIYGDDKKKENKKNIDNKK